MGDGKVNTRTGILVTRGDWKFWQACPRDKVKIAVHNLSALNPSLFRDDAAKVEFVHINDADERVGEAELIPPSEYGR